MSATCSSPRSAAIPRAAEWDGLPGEVNPSLSVRLMGINQRGGAQYLISLYCSVAVLTHDALGALEGVVLDHYHEYA